MGRLAQPLKLSSFSLVNVSLYHKHTAVTVACCQSLIRKTNQSVREGWQWSRKLAWLAQAC